MTQLREDINLLIRSLLASSSSSPVRIRKSKFWSMFVCEYALKYQRRDHYIIASDELLREIQKMAVSGGVRINRAGVKWYKFNIKRLERVMNET